MDGDVIAKLVAAAVVLAAVVLDWPRALAGLAVGFAARRIAQPLWLTIPAGVIAVSALGEVIYPLIGRTGAMSWGSFTFGLIAAGATAYGLHRALRAALDT